MYTCMSTSTCFLILLTFIKILILNLVFNLIVTERSEASNPGRTTEMGVVLYGVHRAFGLYICVCTHKSQISSPHDHVSCWDLP